MSGNEPKGECVMSAARSGESTDTAIEWFDPHTITYRQDGMRERIVLQLPCILPENVQHQVIDEAKRELRMTWRDGYWVEHVLVVNTPYPGAIDTTAQRIITILSNLLAVPFVARRQMV
jgi:hypothetical protein